MSTRRARKLTARLLRNENLPLLRQNGLFIEPQFALPVRFVNSPHPLAGRAFAKRQITLVQHVANFLLVGSHRHRIANRR